MSDTPRTKAATRMAFSGEYMVPIQDAQKLERELAESKKNGCDTCDAFTLANRQLREDVVNLAKQIDPYEREAAKAAINALKRELAEVTKQRDALAEALGPFVTLNPLSKRVQERWHGYVLNAKQALAATKGELHE